jgi:hypothetical protein
MQALVRDPRRTGTALLVFGIVGVFLAAVLAIGLFFGAARAASLGDRLESARTSLVETLQDASFSVGRTALATANLGATVRSSEQALRDTSDLLRDASTAVDSLATAIDISILGQRPFDAAAAQLEALADSLAVTSGSTDELASDLVSNAADLEAIEEELRAIQARLDEAAAELEAGSDLGPLVGMLTLGLVLVGALALWIAIAAGLVAWLGRRLRALDRGMQGDADRS